MPLRWTQAQEPKLSALPSGQTSEEQERLVHLPTACICPSCGGNTKLRARSRVAWNSQGDSRLTAKNQWWLLSCVLRSNLGLCQGQPPEGCRVPPSPLAPPSPPGSPFSSAHMPVPPRMARTAPPLKAECSMRPQLFG